MPMVSELEVCQFVLNVWPVLDYRGPREYAC
jgi:hypothetical protein